MSKSFKIKLKKEIEKLSISEIEIYLEDIQYSLDIKYSKELSDHEEMVRELLLDKYSG